MNAPAVVCGWCGVLMKPGPLVLKLSHGICDPCVTGLQQEVDHIIRPREVDDDGQRFARPVGTPVDPWLVSGGHCPPVGKAPDPRD